MSTHATPEEIPMQDDNGHELAIRVSALAAVGAIVPTSAQGQEQLRQLEALAGAITWICPVEPGVKL